MIRQWIELEMRRCGNQDRMLILNVLWNIMNNTCGYTKENYSEDDWCILLDEIDEIVDNRVKDLKQLVRSKR